MFILANVWKQNSAKCTAGFMNLNTEWMRMLVDALKAHKGEKYNLEQIKDIIKRKLHRAHPNVFTYKRESSLCTIMER